jgi:subtilisin family serine protease
MRSSMRTMRLPLVAGALAAAAFGVSQTATADEQPTRDYVVVFEKGASDAAARQAVEQAGGTVKSVNRDIGVATVSSNRADFASRAAARPELVGAAGERSIGRAPREAQARRRAIEHDVTGPKAGHGNPGSGSGGDPLASRQWDMQMIGATTEGSYRREQASHAVRVGVIDTGIDGSHPDIAPNFDAALSRNFTVDRPDIDGLCEDEPDRSCSDPANVDEDGHGTHVAGTIAAPLNGIGMAGVAPRAELVNLRAGQDSGFFFVQPTVDALTYAADNGVDVVNMSFYVDPWLYNCAANPADSPAEQAEQRTIVAAVQRALDYARAHDVTLISALGNEWTDLGHPTTDETSPDYPVGTEHSREIDNASCLSMPTEADGVIGISSVGPSKRKAFYSNYGTEQTDLAAPGGDSRDTATGLASPQNVILAPYPYDVGVAEKKIGPDGQPTTPAVIREDRNGQVAYYQYIQGTSMAAPHAVGVAALVIADRGKADRVHGGVTLSPDIVERVMRQTATDTACPAPRLFDYPESGPEFDAYCEGSKGRNGFYGDGIVSATGVLARHR